MNLIFSPSRSATAFSTALMMTVGLALATLIATGTVGVRVGLPDRVPIDGLPFRPAPSVGAGIVPLAGIASSLFRAAAGPSSSVVVAGPAVAGPSSRTELKSGSHPAPPVVVAADGSPIGLTQPSAPENQSAQPGAAPATILPTATTASGSHADNNGAGSSQTTIVSPDYPVVVRTDRSGGSLVQAPDRTAPNVQPATTETDR